MGVGEQLLESADRRKRDDAIADMVELDDEDLANFVASQRRPAGDQEVRRLVVDREIVMVLGQMRTEIRIARKEEIAPFAVEDHCIVIIVERSPADRLVMNQRGMRSVNGKQALLPSAQRIVEVVVDDGL